MSRSFRLLVTRPGALTLAYVRGQRRNYLRPLQCFLIANALFFAMQSLTHTDIFSSPLKSHLQHQDWSDFARRLVSDRLSSRNVTLAAYAEQFDVAVKFYAKTLIIMMALAFAPLVIILFGGRRLPIGAHVVFSLHFYVFLMLLFCVSLAVVEVSVMAGGPGLDNGSLDIVLTLFNLASSAVYLWFACRVVYNATGISRILKAATFAVWAAALVPGYRFALFLLAFSTT